MLDAPRIAGVKVRPLSAWHYHVAQLLNIRIEMVKDDNGELIGPTPIDIANSIALFRSEYRPGVVGVPIAGWWLLRVYLPIRWLFRSWRKDAFELMGYVEAFRRYPEVKRKEGGERAELGAPQFFAVAVDVAQRMPSIKLAEALNMSLNWLYCLRATLIELDGGPACAWRTAESPDDIKAALDAAQTAIDRFNAKKNGGCNGTTP